MPRSSLRGDAVWSAFLPFARASLANFEHAHNYLRRPVPREKAARYRVSEEPVRRCAGVPAVRISFAHDGSSIA